MGSTAKWPHPQFSRPCWNLMCCLVIWSQDRILTASLCCAPVTFATPRMNFTPHKAMLSDWKLLLRQSQIFHYKFFVTGCAVWDFQNKDWGSESISINTVNVDPDMYAFIPFSVSDIQLCSLKKTDQVLVEISTDWFLEIIVTSNSC